jgi:hypothetical protein
MRGLAVRLPGRSGLRRLQFGHAPVPRRVTLSQPLAEVLGRPRDHRVTAVVEALEDTGTLMTYAAAELATEPGVIADGSGELPEAWRTK